MTVSGIKKLILPLLTAVSIQAQAQDMLVVNSEFKKNTPYEFNKEWHYLTSELFLFNGTKFQGVISDLYASLSKKAKASAPAPENVLITAKIDGTALGNLSYPIFNFNIDNSNGQIKTFTSDNYEAIRIMDNLPLSSLSNGKIDCNINIDLITKERGTKVYEFVASQLTQIASWTSTPLVCAQTLVGELGALILAKNEKKEYKFNSTIRLYEEEDFSKRVASVSIYSFIPSSHGRSDIDTSAISKFIDSNDNPKLDRNKLTSLVRSSHYPFMVIVNYKSKYVSEPVIGDQTTTETVDARLSKVKKAYESGLLSSEIYTQELKLVEYLYSFVTLKSSINNYILNYKNKITDDFGMQYTQIYDNYTSLRTLLNSRKIEFEKNPIFQNEFLQTYNTILTNADVYLDSDNNLRNIKKISKMVLFDKYEAKNFQFDAEKVENILATLHSVDFPQGHPEFSNLADLYQLIDKLEAEMNKKVFEQKTKKLKAMTPSPEATAYCEELKNDINATYCQSCRESANVVINDYLQRLDKENLRMAQQRLSNSISNARDMIFSLLQKEKILSKHFSEDYGENMPDFVAYLYEDFQKLQHNRENLQLVIKKDYSDQNTTQLNLISDDIDYETQDLAKILDNICKKMPELCE